MLTRLNLIIAIVLLHVSLKGHAESKFDQPFLRSAKKMEEVIEWGKKTYGFCPCYNFEFGEKKCLVLIPDLGSGVFVRVVLIYGFNKNAWELAIVRYTNAGDIKINQNGPVLSFKSKTRKELMDVPISNLEVSYDPKEQ